MTSHLFDSPRSREPRSRELRSDRQGARQHVSRAGKLAAAVTTAVMLAGCGGTATPENAAAGDDAALTPVTLMLNWTPNAHHAGIYYAEAAGLYEAHGIDLTILEPGDGIGADASVAEGQVQFGISQAESVLPARAAGMDVEAVATLLPVNDSVLMGLQQSGFSAEASSLSGLTYGGYGGALETEIISELATCGGSDPKDVEFIDIGNVDYLAGLEQGRFDVTWVFGGWDGIRAQAENSDVALLSMADYESCIPNWYTPVIIGNGAALAADPELAAAFMAATTAGYEAVVNKPAEGSAALLEAAPELDEALVTSAVEYYAPKFTAQGAFGEMDAKVWERFTEFLVQADMLEDATPLDGAWTNEYLPAS